MSNLRKQGTWAVLDQVLSSGTNFVPALILARVLGPSDYGTFTIVFLSWFGALDVLRSALMRPYTLDASSKDVPAWREITARAGGAVVLGGVAFGVLFAIVGLVIGVSSGLGRAYLVIAVLAPGLALQEFWRVASFAGSRARTAAANDLYWAIGQVVAFTILLVHDDVTVGTALFAWGAGAWLAAGVGIWQLSVLPRPDRAAVLWAKQSGKLGAWFTAASSAYALSALGIALVINAELGRADVGLFRSVENLFGPVQLFTIGAASVFLPHLVRVIDQRRSNGLGESWRFGALMAGVIALYGVILLVVAPTVLTEVFGPEFEPASSLVLPFLIAYAIDGVGNGALMLLSARAMPARLLVATTIGAFVRVGAVALLASLAGLEGAAWGLVVGSIALTLAKWVQVALVSQADPSVARPGAAPTYSP